MVDLEGNGGVADGPYVVTDAFVEDRPIDAPPDEGSTVHVELKSLFDLMAAAPGDDVD